MTKHAADENALKYSLTVEEPRKLIEDKLLVVCDAQASLELKSNLEVTSIKTGTKEMRLELYNIEDSVESDKPMKIELDLDLYQMEQL